MVIRRVRHEAKHIPEHADEFDFEPEHEFWCTTHPLINLLSQIFFRYCLDFSDFLKISSVQNEKVTTQADQKWTPR